MNIVRETAFQVICSRPGWRSFLFLAVSLLVIIVLGGFLLFAVSGLPQQPLRQHLKDAQAEGYLAHNYPKQNGLRVLNKRLDMYTECVGLGIAVTMRPEAETLLSMSSFGECAGLTRAVAEDFAVSPGPYMRYVHGYQIFLKPLYTLFPIGAVRLITGAVTVGLLALLFITLRNHLNAVYAAVIVLSFFVTKSSHVFLLVTHAAQFWLVLTGAILAVCLRHRASPFLLFGILGVCDTFFSFLSMGSLSLGLPLLCYALTLWRDGRAPVEIIAALWWGGIGWSIGFVVPWLVKWTVLEWTLHPSTAQLFGATLDVYPTRSVRMIGTALFRNCKALQWQIGLLVCALLIAGKRRCRRTVPSGLWAALLPALVPVIWICILPGQSGVMHSFFVNVILWPGIAALFLLLSALPPLSPQRNEDHS